MPNNTGFLLLMGLGALLFLGRGPKGGDAEDPEVDDPSMTISGSESAAESSSGDLPVIIVTPRQVQIGGGEVASETEKAVRGSEKVAKAEFALSAGIHEPVGTTIVVSQGDLDAIAFSEGTFAYGGAPRPTATAHPVWNNTYGWYWKNPIGGAVGPGGKEWRPGDTSTNMGSPGTNIGKTLPPGWKKNRGGSADWVGLPEHDFELA